MTKVKKMTEKGVICARVVLSVFNAIQFVCGWVLIVLGALVSVQSSSNQYHSQGSQEGTAIFLIVFGCILVVVSLIGCFGAWTKNLCLLVTFCVFTAIGFILVIVLMAMAYSGSSKSEEALGRGLNEMMKMNDTRVYESLQFQLKCCGINSHEDWSMYPIYNATKRLPQSCCASNVRDCNYKNPGLFKQGCKPVLSKMVNHFLYLIGHASAVSAAVMLFAIIAAVYMAYSVRSSYQPV